MQKLLTVIIPIYNVQDTLDRCLQSVINQTYSNLEIILVNDGSTDSSLRICRKYADNDSRIIILDKENGGLSSARNAGLDIMTGDYVSFLDSDDYIEITMYEKLLSCIDFYNVDTVLCSTQRLTSDGKKIKIVENYKNQLFENSSIIKDLLLCMFNNPQSIANRSYQYEMAVWRSIYSSNIIKCNNIRFVSEREIISEDIIFDLDYYPHSKKVFYLNEYLHFYCINSVSLTASYKDETIEKLFSLHHLIVMKLESMGINNVYYADHLLLTRIRDLIHLCVLKNGNLKLLLLKINSSPLVKQIYKRYPFNKISNKQKIFYRLVRTNNTLIIKSIIYLNSRRKKR